MGRPMRVLLIEDDERDAALVLRELARGGLEVTAERVDTENGVRGALDRARWDVVLCDYSMPQLDALTAHRLMLAKNLDLPFIIVSGAVDEESAVDAMRAGVHDYFRKDRLGPKLLAAIEREVREAEIRAERRRMEEQLLISDRMVSMGTLAAGVAHEINNPLACVIANLDMAVMDLLERGERHGLSGELHEVCEELHDARDAAERIRHIVGDLKIFSRSRDDRTGPVDVERVLESTLRMAWNEIRHRARLVRRYAPTPAVEASESRLGQVFLNLVVNAAQAIPEGQAERHELRVATGVSEAGEVVVEVADTGSGMSPEVQRRLFTPFFTTKPVGVGTGLGLSICHRILTGIGGRIEVSSVEGRGTTVRVALVPARGAVVHATPRPAGAPAGHRRGRILVVDDEPMILRAVERTLAAEHEVVAAGGGAEALERLAAGERFDVVLCDLMMPEMSGMDLHVEMSRSTPEQAGRMVFLTGGAFTARASAFLDAVGNRRIEKPFGALQLRALVQEQLRIFEGGAEGRGAREGASARGPKGGRS